MTPANALISKINPPQDATPSWKQQLAHAIKTVPELINYLDLPPKLALSMGQAQQDFRIMVPTPYLDRIEKGNLADPLLLQILPTEQELARPEGYVQDPLAEKNYSPQKSVVHKYKNRVLVILASSCAINCRYCFRRHFPYGEHQQEKGEWQQLLDYLQQHPSVNEVIFSGGDPLMLKDSQIAERIQTLNALPQLKRIRFHTRLPVVIPQRVCDEMLAWINASKLDIIMVLHTNHANEIDAEVEQAMQKLTDAKVTLLNQGVLLRGVNDSVEAQVALSERVFAAGILPYYMFTLDSVAGAAHFDIPVEEAQQLMGQVAAELPGYLVPRLAKEIPGKRAKSIFAPIL